MNKLSLVSIAATLALVTACSPAGIKPPSEPAPPVVRLIAPPPCVTQRGPQPGPILLSIQRDATRTQEQDDALWAYVEALEDYRDRAYQNCGPKEPTK